MLHTTNAEQWRAWDGDEGAYWAAHADRFDRAVAPHHDRLMAAAAISAGERVLDIGCGTGQTTRDAARAASPGGTALGVDLSSGMLDVARARAADDGLDNVAFAQVDAQVHPFDPASFDVAISRTGAMFFGEPVVAFTNIARALRPGGRMALVAWQSFADNEWIREITGALTGGRPLSPPPPDAPGPFSLADPARVHALLDAAGFVDVDLTGVSAPEWFGVDADDAHAFVLGLTGWMLRDADDDTRGRAVDALRSTMRAHEGPDGVTFASAAWVITAKRAA
ncbi:MAG TPA: class I SAM-dependent methyltransferase [Acidimicrobiales bacterium]|jgi:SAM-dependent methyltransferase|nr:class I SAM-dependent methyltransferase [Acidimicrobiales bacterium]